MHQVTEADCSTYMKLMHIRLLYFPCAEVLCYKDELRLRKVKTKRTVNKDDITKVTYVDLGAKCLDAPTLAVLTARRSPDMCFFTLFGLT